MFLSEATCGPLTVRQWDFIKVWERKLLDIAVWLGTPRQIKHKGTNKQTKEAE